MACVVGIDLAWGRRAPSGICVVDGHTVMHSATVTGDDDILATVPAGTAVVALDAPIVVSNTTGRRRCDAEISRCFTRYDAGAYPANRSLPWLREPRGGVIAQRLGASLRLGGATPVAVEVYPHAATVALFALPRTLKYKAGRGRTLASRRDALRTLLGHLAGLRHARPRLDVRSARWSQLVAQVADAPTQSALQQVEHEVDAHVCAYVAVLARDDPARVAVVGEPTEGAIVTPVTPALAACLGR